MYITKPCGGEVKIIATINLTKNGIHVKARQELSSDERIGIN